MAKSPTTIVAPAWPDDTGPWKSGWQHVVIVADWRDKDVVLGSIADLDQPDVILSYEAVATFACENDTDMVQFYIAADHPTKLQWDKIERTAYLDPCDDPVAVQDWIAIERPYVRLELAARFEIDMREERTYHRFVVGCDNRLSMLQGALPQVEFVER